MRTKFSLYPELSCPFCRVGFGGLKARMTKPTHKWYKFWEKPKSPEIDTIFHLDIFWSRESGLHTDCQNLEYLKTQIKSVDENGNLILTEELQKKIKELNDKYNYKPDDIKNDTCDWKDFHILFANALNWGMVDGDNEEYDRESMKWDDIRVMFDEGKNLYEILRHYIVESEE